jgi:collagen type I alpha
MRPLIRLACGLAAGMLLLLAGASVAFAAEPLVIVDGSGGNSNDVSAGANTGTTSGTVTLGAQAPTSTADNADGSATVTLGAGAPNSTGDTDGSASVTLGSGSPTTADGADGSGTVTLGAGAPNSTGDTDGSASVTLGSGSPTTADGADGSGTVTLGAGAPNSTGDTDGRADGSATFTFGAGSPNSIGDPSSSVGALSSGFASLIANGDSAAEDATGVAPGAPSTDGATFGLSQAFGSVLSSFGLAGAPGAPGGSGGSGSGNATAGASGDDTLPETSTGEFASGPGTDLPVLVLFLGLLAGGLAALRRTVRSAG